MRIKRRAKRISKKDELNFKDASAMLSYSGWLKHCDSYRLAEKYIVPIQPYADRYYKDHIKKKGGKKKNETVSESEKCSAA